jgi:glutamyl endopeptidase
MKAGGPLTVTNRDEVVMSHETDSIDSKKKEKAKQRRRGKTSIPKPEIVVRSATGKRRSQRLEGEIASHVAGLSALPEGEFSDIAELSLWPESQELARVRGLGVAEVAASPADRIRVADPRQSPWRKVCDLLITARDGGLHTGTAWFISPRTLVTAGHCISVFRPGAPAHGMVSKILVMAARNGETDPSHSAFGWVEVQQTDLRVHDAWRLNGNIDFDFGAIILPPNLPLGTTVGFFGYGHFPDANLLGTRPTLSGYPDDVPEGTQWFETNPIRQLTPTRLFYDIFTASGQSGSPVFFANATQQVACAIHNFGATPLNSGVRITPPVVAQLNAWRI